MEKDCIYCGTNFTAIRSSKKYCSDNCKQMAYFKRNGLILSGAETSNLKYERPVIVKAEKITSPVQPIVKEEKQTFKKEIVKFDPVRMDDKMLETIISRLSIAMERKMEQAIEKVKQELNSKYENLIVKSNLAINDKTDEPAKQLCSSVSYTEAIRPIREHKSKINYCNSCEGLIVKCGTPKENAIIPNIKNQQKHFTISGINEPELINTTAESKNSILNTENNKTNQQEDHAEQKEQEKQEEKENKIPHQIQALELADDEEEYNEQEFEELEHEQEFEEEEEQEQEEDAEEQQEKDHNTETIQEQESDHKIIKLIAELENKNSIVEEKHEEEPKYKWVESKFIKSIEKNYLNNNEYLFKDPKEHWSINQAKNVNWITVRLRCLVESMIKLSNYNRIDAHTLCCITDAFNRLVKSNAFKNLPKNYPYAELIKELCIKLNHLVQQNKYSELLKFSLSAELKSKLISIRYEMLNYFPAIKFSELDFEEEKDSLKKIKNDESEAEQEDMEEENEERSGTKKAWRIKYESMKRQQLRNAA